mgnify:CR=1 FL=1
MSQNNESSAHTSITRSADADRGLLATVARAYYIENLTRLEIAELLGISRFKVARLLSRAREEGVVEIAINDVGLPDALLAARLKALLGLDACLVVNCHGDDESIRRQVGGAAAGMLSETLQAGEVLGVAWGRTLTATAELVGELPPLTIVQLTGFVARDLRASPIDVLRQASRRWDSEVYPVFAPLCVPDPETAAGLRGHPDIKAAMDLFPSVTTALLSVGSWEPPDSLVRDVLAADDLANAVERGCVADIAGILVGEDGSPVDPEFQERCINISYEQLRAVPRVIAVVGGAAKARAIRAVAGAGLISELVTDQRLAHAILDGAAVSL